MPYFSLNLVWERGFFQSLIPPWILPIIQKFIFFYLPMDLSGQVCVVAVIHQKRLWEGFHSAYPLMYESVFKVGAVVDPHGSLSWIR